MGDNDDVLFVREDGNASGSNSNDIWDDSVLIKAYDKAVNLAKEQVAKRLSMETDSSRGKGNKGQNSKQFNRQRNQRKWTVGSPCRAIYSVDGEEYEAIISKIFENDCGTCIVKFVGYGNTEKVELASLRESDGLESQIAQQKESQAMKDTSEYQNNAATTFNYEQSKVNGERMDYENEVPRQGKSTGIPEPLFNSYGMTPPAPPLPPQLMAKLPENDADALSSMLMSWYISGFHTGYYHGIKQAQITAEKRKK